MCAGNTARAGRSAGMPFGRRGRSAANQAGQSGAAAAFGLCARTDSRHTQRVCFFAAGGWRRGRFFAAGGTIGRHARRPGAGAHLCAEQTRQGNAARGRSVENFAAGAGNNCGYAGKGALRFFCHSGGQAAAGSVYSQRPHRRRAARAAGGGENYGLPTGKPQRGRRSDGGFGPGRLGRRGSVGHHPPLWAEGKI